MIGVVLAAKIFRMKDGADIEDILIKLRDHRSAEVFEEGDRTFELVTEIRDLEMKGEASFSGTFTQDQLIYITHRGEHVPTPVTMTAPFIFDKADDGTILLTVLEKKRKANMVANALSKLVFLTTGHIVEARITPETMRRFHEANFEDTKITFFDDVDIPNVSKLSLYGSELGNTSLYTEYLKHGKLWYTVIRSKKYGYIIGITRNCVVAGFSKIEQSDFINYVREEVFPLITRGDER